MPFVDHRPGAVPVAIAAALVMLGLSASRAQPPDAAGHQVSSSPHVSQLRPSPEEPAATISRHPLEAVIQYARREQNYLKQSVNDFTCRLVKRELIGGFLQDMQYIDMQVREELVADGRLVRPLSIYMHFLGPKLVAGRRVIYVKGQNEGKMLVRNGGRHFDYVIVRLDPDGENAREETLVPITQIGFTQLLSQMIAVLERHQKADPTGGNSLTERIAGAKIENRPCTVIRVTHPQPAKGLEFHVANVFVDNELHAPIRVDYSGWPKYPRGPAPLIAEYTYTDLKLNVNLPDAAFGRSRLRSQRDP